LAAKIMALGLLVDNRRAGEIVDFPQEARDDLVGWDWASCTHDVTVLDDDGGVRERWSLPHTEVGWASTACGYWAKPRRSLIHR
jgi:hypothetical protein